MIKRRRFKQTLSLKDRLAALSKELREQADHARHRPEREQLLTRAGRANTAAHLDDWINSPGLRRPE